MGHGRGKKTVRLKSAGRAKRHPLWSQDQFLSDLREYRQIKKVCEIYADKVDADGNAKDKTGWRAYYSDQWRWRRADPEFDKTVVAILAEQGLDRPDNGRPRNDGGDKSWQNKFCDSLVQYNWSFERAASSTPYTPRQLVEFLDPVCSSYDAEFARMVEGAEMVLASRAREIIVGEGLNPESFTDFDATKILQVRLWNAHKTLEKLEKRFSKRQVEVSGTIDHTHRHRLMSREENLSLLWEERKRFEKTRSELVTLDSRALASGDDAEAVEVEVVSVD